jgi:apolipoprotein N-acyltransferase
MNHRASHLVRDVAFIVTAVVILAVVSWIFVDYGFALAIVLMIGALAILLVPAVGIYYEERDVPHDRLRT